MDKRERLNAEERKAMIMDTALTLFSARGFAATTTKEIAAAAGISETLIFHYFETKDELIRSSLAVLFHPHPVSGELVRYLNDLTNDEEFFRTLALHIIEHNHADPRIMRLAIYCSLEGRHFAELARSNETGPLTIISDYIRRRISKGDFEKIDAAIAAQLFVEAVFMFVADQQAQISGPRIETSHEKVVDTLVAIFVNGLKKRIA